jgi:hypothetical protein
VGTILHKWKRKWADYVQNNLMDYRKKAKTVKWNGGGGKKTENIHYRLTAQSNKA